MHYYSLDKIKKTNATYNVIFGKRSNGKTYAVLNEILTQYFKTGKQGAIIRRTQEDFRSTRGANVFNALIENGVIEKLSKGAYTTVVYYNRAWYFGLFDESLNRTVRADTPFCYAFALNTSEHDKSSSYPNITTILFDEFISRYNYLTDEFILFENAISTIVRNRTDAKIYMCGNSINVYCPYFNELGLTHIKQMIPGDIDVYTYGENKELVVAVEYCENTKSHNSNKYFGFDNPKLSMIKNGSWELDIYPHLVEKYTRKDVLFYVQIDFNGETFTMDIVNGEKGIFGFVHPKTTPIDYTKDFVLTTTDTPRFNVSSDILHPIQPWEKQVAKLFAMHKVFYLDNTVGCTIENFIATIAKKGRIK